jgi:Nucleotidyltransferase domain
VDDEDFADYIASALASLPGVLAVSLGGSRATGTNRPDSDWDFSLYYRAHFDPDDLRALGWPGEIFPVGGWGGGVFNGGAWLRVQDRQVDVELAQHRVLRGSLPRPEYPDELRIAASQRWHRNAEMTLGYARQAHAARGHVTETAGFIATAAIQAAHGILAGRGEWVTNEKTLLDRAGLRPVDAILEGLTAGPDHLKRAVDAAERLLGNEAV